MIRLPPVICILILDVDGSKASPTGTSPSLYIMVHSWLSADFRKPVKMLIPTLFYVSLLHSLVARATIRQMLGTSLASNGMLKPDLSTQAGESIFVATYGGSESKGDGDVKERDLEAGEVVVPIQVSLLLMSIGSELINSLTEGMLLVCPIHLTRIPLFERD